MLWRPGEALPWEPTSAPNPQRHDEDMPELQCSNYFTPHRFYCVKNICAPCGVVIAWAKFANAESPENFLNFFKQSIQQRSLSQLISVLTKLAKFIIASQMAVGTHEKKPAD
jgi:hypothetical protein